MILFSLFAYLFSLSLHVPGLLNNYSLFYKVLSSRIAQTINNYLDYFSILGLSQGTNFLGSLAPKTKSATDLYLHSWLEEGHTDTV